eukprot:4897808-Alexandrium_andersonii.AAC.1
MTDPPPCTNGPRASSPCWGRVVSRRGAPAPEPSVGFCRLGCAIPSGWPRRLSRGLASPWPQANS